MKLAALDLGTNTFELLIAEVSPSGEWTPLTNEEVPVFLGKGGIEACRIGDEAQQRALNCLSEFAEKIKSQHCTRVRCIATSAFRNSKNAEQLKQKISDKTGFMVEVIDGDREATFIAMGTALAMKGIEAPFMVMDIGGGSTEFVIMLKGQILFKQSIEMGATRLLERHLISDPPAKDLEEMRSDIAQAFAPILDEIKKYGASTLVGGSGTFDTFKAILGLTETHTRAAFPMKAFTALLEKIPKLNRQERIGLNGLTEFRKDTIVPSALMVEHFLENGIENVYWSGMALKEGLMEEMIRGSRIEM